MSADLSSGSFGGTPWAPKHLGVVRCVCWHPSARECARQRYGPMPYMDDYDSFDERCDCCCHDGDIDIDEDGPWGAAT